MHAMRGMGALRSVAFTLACAVAQAACDAPTGSDSERTGLSQSALERAAVARAGADTSEAEAPHVAFAAGSYDSRLELGGRRLLVPSCDSDDPACVPSEPRQHIFVASLDQRGRARWLVAPLRSAEASRLYDTEVHQDGVYVLASYRGALALHRPLPAPASDEVGLVLLELDRRGSLISAHKLADSPGYTAAQFAREPSGTLRVDVTFQGRLALPQGNVVAWSGGARASLYLDASSPSVLLGQVTQLPSESNCPASLALCDDVAWPLSGCDAQRICQKDPFCCNHSWDALCVTEATERLLDCPCTHAIDTIGLRLPRNCLTVQGNDCPSKICDGNHPDPYCCDTFWDGICVNSVVDGACN
jgi:hypothetical protein